MTLVFSADGLGIWCTQDAGRPFGMEWSEIFAVGGYKLDGITEVYTIVELDHTNGHFLELNADRPGFADVIKAISANLPGIDENWFELIDSLKTDDLPITIWRRDQTDVA